LQQIPGDEGLDQEDARIDGDGNGNLKLIEQIEESDLYFLLSKTPFSHIEKQDD
jgi:hypothetical protein